MGGWPQTIQAEVTWPVNDVEFVIQVDSDQKANIGIADAGTASIGWSPTRGWLLSWQCY